MERSILAMNRRSFIGTLAAAGATAAAVGAGAFVPRADAQTTNPVIDILNFALNLEFLEANLYIAVSGAPALSTTMVNGGKAPINVPTGITLDAQTKATAAGLAADETHHISTLIAAIMGQGGTPIAQPAIDYRAGGTVSITTQAQFLAVARQFTAVGNSAYAGAAQFLVSNPSLLSAAAQILGAEGQHLGAINYLCALQGVMSPAVDTLDVPPTLVAHVLLHGGLHRPWHSRRHSLLYLLPCRRRLLHPLPPSSLLLARRSASSAPFRMCWVSSMARPWLPITHRQRLA